MHRAFKNVISVLPFFYVCKSSVSLRLQICTQIFLDATTQRCLWGPSRMRIRSVESIWNVMAHCDAREGKWRGNWRMEWVASTLHPTSEHGVSSITTVDAHTSAASSRLNWRPRWFEWTRPFHRKTKSGYCACAITFQTQSTSGKRGDTKTIVLRIRESLPVPSTCAHVDAVTWSRHRSALALHTGCSETVCNYFLERTLWPSHRRDGWFWINGGIIIYEGNLMFSDVNLSQYHLVHYRYPMQGRNEADWTD